MKKLNDLQVVSAGAKNTYDYIKTDADFLDLLLSLEDKRSGETIVSIINKNRDMKKMVKDYDCFITGYNFFLNNPFLFM